MYYLWGSVSSRPWRSPFEWSWIKPSSGSLVTLPSTDPPISSTVRSENDVAVEKFNGVPSIASKTLTWSLQVDCSSKPRSWLAKEMEELLLAVSELLISLAWILFEDNDDPWRTGGVGGFLMLHDSSLWILFELLKPKITLLKHHVIWAQSNGVLEIITFIRTCIWNT